MRQNDYAPQRRFVNVEGQDTFPIRLPNDRMAWLVLPCDFRQDDIDRLIDYMRLIADVDAVRNPGPPEPNGKLP